MSEDASPTTAFGDVLAKLSSFDARNFKAIVDFMGENFGPQTFDKSDVTLSRSVVMFIAESKSPQQLFDGFSNFCLSDGIYPEVFSLVDRDGNPFLVYLHPELKGNNRLKFSDSLEILERVGLIHRRQIVGDYSGGTYDLFFSNITRFGWRFNVACVS